MYAKLLMLTKVALVLSMAEDSIFSAAYFAACSVVNDPNPSDLQHRWLIGVY